jgi:hypothetical protein
MCACIETRQVADFCTGKVCFLIFREVAKSILTLDLKQKISYILQLSLVHRRFVGERPSVLAKASLILADEILGEKYWMTNDGRLVNCIHQLSSILVDPPKELFRKVYEFYLLKKG